MSRAHFEDDCEGCRPAVLDLQTKKPLPADHPVMKALAMVWDGTTRDERAAFHRFTCLNSREPTDLVLVHGIQQKFQRVCDAL